MNTRGNFIVLNLESPRARIQIMPIPPVLIIIQCINGKRNPDMNANGDDVFYNAFKCREKTFGEF